MRISVLDHGYIELIEFWGTDERIIEAARMSTGKGFVSWEKDEKLLNYLWKNKHTTPFEMSGMTIEVQAPIFVFREWHRHRTQSYNEMSARYTPLPDVNYLPSIERLLITSSTNKQAQSTGNILSSSSAQTFQDMIRQLYIELEDAYQMALTNGVPKELARIILPVGRYSKMRASANLWNWLRFLKLRLDSHAQFEIREYAKTVSDILWEQFPKTMKLFKEEYNAQNS